MTQVYMVKEYYRENMRYEAEESYVTFGVYDSEEKAMDAIRRYILECLKIPECRVLEYLDKAIPLNCENEWLDDPLGTKSAHCYAYIILTCHKVEINRDLWNDGEWL